MDSLSPIEKKIYEYIKKTVSEKGYSPSVRDIAGELALKSTSTVHYHLKRLEEAGYIFKENGKSRTVRADGESGSLINRIPILGDIREGSPLSAEDNFDGYVDFAVPKGYRREDLFAVRVKGDASANVGILDGDIVIVYKTDSVSDGEISVSVCESELSVTEFYRENKSIQNTIAKLSFLRNVKLLGKVIASVRFY